MLDEPDRYSVGSTHVDETHFHTAPHLRLSAHAGRVAREIRFVNIFSGRITQTKFAADLCPALAHATKLMSTNEFHNDLAVTILYSDFLILKKEGAQAYKMGVRRANMLRNRAIRCRSER
jgi:hypothetical protein